MQINRGLLSWGVFLIVAGLIPLALRAGWLSASQIAGWWTLWPLVLIGIGVGLVLTRTPFEVLGSVLVAGTFGLMLGAVLAIGISGFPGGVCGNELGSNAYDEQTGTFDGPADVDIEFNCGALAVTGAEGSTWTFAGRGDGDVAPEVEADASSLRIRGAERSFVPFSKGEHWNVTLPEDVALGIRVQLNAGDATVEPGAVELTDVEIQVNFGQIVAVLGEATALDSVDIQTNAGSASVTLPNLSLTGRLQVNAGSLELCTARRRGRPHPDGRWPRLEQLRRRRACPGRRHLGVPRLRRRRDPDRSRGRGEPGEHRPEPGGRLRPACRLTWRRARGRPVRLRHGWPSSAGRDPCGRRHRRRARHPVAGVRGLPNGVAHQ